MMKDNRGIESAGTSFYQLIRRLAPAVANFSLFIAIFIYSVIVAPPAPAENVCWQGKPAPACRYFLITEFGLGGNLNSAADPNRADHVSTEMLIYDLGLMVNAGGSSAWGGTVSFKAMYETRLGLFGRYRRWLGENWAVDISPGIILIGSSNDGRYGLEYPTAAGRIAINYGDWVGVGIGTELVRIWDGDSEVDWYADVHLGYYPGAILGILFTVFGVLAASSLAVPQGEKSVI